MQLTEAWDQIDIDTLSDDEVAELALAIRSDRSNPSLADQMLEVFQKLLISEDLQQEMN